MARCCRSIRLGPTLEGGGGLGYMAAFRVWGPHLPEGVVWGYTGQ